MLTLRIVLQKSWIKCFKSLTLKCVILSRFVQFLQTYLFSFVETPRKFIIAELSIRKLGSSSVLIIQSIISILLALMKIRAYGSKALQYNNNNKFTWCLHKAKQVYYIHHANVQGTYFCKPIFALLIPICIKASFDFFS